MESSKQSSYLFICKDITTLFIATILWASRESTNGLKVETHIFTPQASTWTLRTENKRKNRWEQM